MGVPQPPAQYIITSTLAAPALFQMGVPLLSAHLFCLYFGVLAEVTPPVALATYAAAGIAKEQRHEDGLHGSCHRHGGVPRSLHVRLQSPPALPGNILQVAFSFVTALMAIIGLSAGVQGYYSPRSPFPTESPLLIGPFCSSTET